MSRVTFDSNVWEKLVDPQVLVTDSDQRAPFLTVRNAIQSGQVEAFLCDTVAVLEGIKTKERAKFLANQKPDPRAFEYFGSDGSTLRGVTMAPDQTQRPPLMPVLSDRLARAAALGVKFLRFPRGIDRHLPLAWYADTCDDYYERAGSIDAEIRSRGVGKSVIEAVGLRLAMRQPGGGIFFDIPDVALTEDEGKEIARAVAEWADGDTVSCHVAYRNDVFCTGDKGGKLGRRISVLNNVNRAWLKDSYGVQFATVEQLAARL